MILFSFFPKLQTQKFPQKKFIHSIMYFLLIFHFFSSIQFHLNFKIVGNFSKRRKQRFTTIYLTVFISWGVLSIQLNFKSKSFTKNSPFSFNAYLTPFVTWHDNVLNKTVLSWQRVETSNAKLGWQMANPTTKETHNRERARAWERNNFLHMTNQKRTIQALNSRTLWFVDS